jgi:hypothetical protein
VALEHGLALLGYRLDGPLPIAAGQHLNLLTVWRATDQMPAEASDLRVFVHLLDGSGTVLAGEDRLDSQPPTWETGDVLVQYHRLALGDNVAPGTYYLELGVYKAITMERLSILSEGVAVADRLLLQQVEVVRP